MKKSILIAIVFVLIGGAVLGRRWWVKSTAEVTALAAGPAPAAVIPDSTVLELTGRVSAGGTEPVLAKTTGRVRTIFFAEGDFVRQGAVLAKLNNFTFVLAPHSGFLVSRHLTAGQYLNRTTAIGTISTRPYLLVPVVVPATEAASIRPGDSVRVWAAARPTRVVTGVASPAAADDPAGTNLEIRLTSRAPLRIGEQAKVQLHRQGLAAPVADAAPAAHR
ncbi:HlyD family efflux transporter periplasmic adaptor subunit [Hymenobacter rubidus]|uniref:HlyD family efflux transporter periplasmic adaptor subunit n=1 Tax=Hymenobacter rubidus TaxID=1441626 RepID=UPI00191EF156|nr:HlyD family efflux transporter periplasmic adaptor subunit [Hymenobacter rubidus]